MLGNVSNITFLGAFAVGEQGSFPEPELSKSGCGNYNMWWDLFVSVRFALRIPNIGPRAQYYKSFSERSCKVTIKQNPMTYMAFEYETSLILVPRFPALRPQPEAPLCCCHSSMPETAKRSGSWSTGWMGIAHFGLAQNHEVPKYRLPQP